MRPVCHGCRLSLRRRLLACLLMWLNGVFPHFMTVRPSHLRLAFLGCGYITRVHSGHLPALGGLIVPSYASRDRSKADQYRRSYAVTGTIANSPSAIPTPAAGAASGAVPRRFPPP